jgi:hypothetical protein
MWDVGILVLLLSPVAPPVPHQAPPPAWDALKRVALQLEVVGPHERWIDDFRSEVDYCRRHFQELVYAPPLSDCERLPPLYLARECTCFSSGYQRYLELRRQVCLYREEELSEALHEAQELCIVWGLVETAASTSQSWASRRRALLELRDRLGPEAYYAGNLPPCVPLWRYEPARP